MTLGETGTLAAATAGVALVLARATAVGVLPRIALPHPDAAFLRDGGWSGGLRRWETLRALVVAVALAATLLFGLPPIAALLAAPLPSLWIRSRAEGARDRARRALAPIVASTGAALRSGTSIADALRRAADAAEPLAARPITDALRAFELGASLDVALQTAAEAGGDDRSRIALGALALGVGERLPRERLAELLAVVGDRLAFEDRLDDDVRAHAAGARQQQRLLAALVPAIALYLSITIPTLAATLGSDLGRYVLIPVAATLEAAAVLLGRRVVRDAVR